MSLKSVKDDEFYHIFIKPIFLKGTDLKELPESEYSNFRPMIKCECGQMVDYLEVEKHLYYYHEKYGYTLEQMETGTSL